MLMVARGRIEALSRLETYAALPPGDEDDLPEMALAV